MELKTSLIGNQPDVEGVPTLAVEDGRASIRLNRPSRHNRFEQADMSAMTGLIERLGGDSRIRVLVVTARGPSFSAGADIGGFRGDGTSQNTDAFMHLCDCLEAFPATTICGLNGSVYGGATDLALACDIRIGVQGSRMLMPAARLGIQYYHSGLRRYIERLGLSASQRLFLTGEPIDADAMLRIGFLSELVASDDLPDRLDAVAKACGERSPAATRGIKRSLKAIARGEGDPAEIQCQFNESLASADAKEGLLAWSQKRSPLFQDPQIQT